MNHIVATAGIGSAWGFIAVVGCFVIGLPAMVTAAIVCLKRKSLKAGVVAIVIIALQGALLRPWHIEKPYDSGDPDQIEDSSEARQLRAVWIGISTISLALILAAYLRKGKGPNHSTEPAPGAIH